MKLYFFLFLFLVSLKSSSQSKNIEIFVSTLPDLKKDIKDSICINVTLGKDSKTFFFTDSFHLNLNTIKDSLILIYATKYVDYPELKLVKKFALDTFCLIKNDNTVLKLNFPEDYYENKNFKNKTCPICKKSDKVIEIVYGLIPLSQEGEDHSAYAKYGEYYHWGCDLYNCSKTWHCNRDNIEF